MTSSTSADSIRDFHDLLESLSEGSVRRRFDPYLDIDWDHPDMRLDPDDPRWVLSQDVDPLGATSWYLGLPLERQIEMGRWRTMNMIKVGAAFETMLIRAMMQHIMALPNGAPEFRYSLHEMTEECHHIQMFQEAVNRSGCDVPGMRPMFRVLAPLISVAGGYLPTVAYIGILAGEEPIDHYQKAIIREGSAIPPAVLRTMEIHIAEEARHISFAGEYLRIRIPRSSAPARLFYSVVFPLLMRYLAGQIMVPPRSFFHEFDIPDHVRREAFWRGPQARGTLAGYFGDMRALATDLDLMNPVSARLWKTLGIGGRVSRYRGEPGRSVHRAA